MQRSVHFWNAAFRRQRRIWSSALQHPGPLIFLGIPRNLALGCGPMNLDEAQRRQVGQWIEQGLKLSEIQDRLAAELGLRLTYMEVRLLVDDLKLTPKDVEPPKRGPATL